MNRLFVSIPLSQQVKQELLASVDTDAGQSIRMGDPKTLHVTIVFMGNTEEGRLNDIQKKLAEVIKDHQLFKLHFDSIIFAPPGRSNPHMIWARYKVSNEFNRLVEDIHKALDIPPQHRQTIPHVTLARFKPQVDVSQIKLIQPDIDQVEVSSIDLMDSELTPAGAVYTVIETFKLQ